MEFQKISGWSLLIIGLVILGWSIYASFNIFTARAQAPQVFKIENQQTPAPSGAEKAATPEELQQQMEDVVSEQLKQIIPTELIYNLLNLICWIAFASFLVFAGFQTGSLGIKLIRK